MEPRRLIGNSSDRRNPTVPTWSIPKATTLTRSRSTFQRRNPTVPTWSTPTMDEQVPGLKVALRSQSHHPDLVNSNQPGRRGPHRKLQRVVSIPPTRPGQFQRIQEGHAVAL